MFRQLIACICLLSAFALNAQEPTPASANRLGALSNLLKIEKTSVNFSSYYERMDYASSATPDYDWWTALLTVKLETASVNNFSLATELAAHMELYDDTQDRYQVDIEDEAKESMSLLYLQYKTDKILARLGRIDRMGSHFDDNRYEGLIAQYQIQENLSVLAGAISSFAEIDYDDAEEFYRVTRNHGGRADKYVFFTEAKAKVAKIADINPFIYTQSDYASVYGIDNKVTIGDTAKFGGILNYHDINSEVGGLNDAQNYDVGVFTELKSGKSTLYVQAGNTKIDGKNSGGTLFRPNWFRDYMFYGDQCQEYKEDACTYYIYTKVSSELAGNKCWASVYLADIEYAPSSDIEAIELQVGYNITEKLDINIRYFIYELNDDAGDDFKKTEARLRYKF